MYKYDGDTRNFLPTFMNVFLAPIAYFLFSGLGQVIHTTGMRGEPNTKGKYNFSALVQMLTRETIHHGTGVKMCLLFDGYGTSVIKVPCPTVGATTSHQVGVGPGYLFCGVGRE